MNHTMKTAEIEAQQLRPYTEPELADQWVVADGMTTTLDRWDARVGGSWRYAAARGRIEFNFHGCFHNVRPDRIAHTFTRECDPGTVALESVYCEEPDDARTRLRAQPEVSVHQRYAKLDVLLATGEIAGTPEGAQA